MKEFDGNVYLEIVEDNAYVDCECGEYVEVGSWSVMRCPKCNRGYRIEKTIFVYEPKEMDNFYPEYEV